MNETFSVELDLVLSKFKENLKKSKNDIESWTKQMSEKAVVSPNVEYLSDLTTPEFGNDLKIRKLANELNVAEMEADSLQSKFSILSNKIKEIPEWKHNTSEYDDLLNKLNKTEIALTKAGNKVDELYSKIEDRKLKLDNFDEIEKKVSSITKNSNNSFDKGVKSLKRFTLSLFSLHSMWSLVSRSASSYLSMNEELNASSQLISNTLGATLAPAIEKVVDIGQYGVIIFAKLVEFFTGYNALSKVTTSNINNMNKASKGLNKTLASFDEIQNLNSTSGVSGSVMADLKALDEFYDKVEEVTRWFNEWEKSSFAQTLKSAVDWFGSLDGSMQLTLATGGLLLLKLGSGSGLLGTLGMLVASPWVIKLTIDSIEKVKSGIKDLENETNNVEKSASGVAKGFKKVSENTIEWYEKGLIGTEQLDRNISIFKENISKNERQIASLKELKDNVGFLENVFTNNSAVYSRCIKSEIEKNDSLIDSLYEVYLSLGLDKDATDFLVESMQNQINNIEILNKGQSTNSEEYKTNISRIEELKEKINSLTSSSLKNQIKELEETNKTLNANSSQYKENIKKIDELKEKLKNIDGTKANATISIDADTSKAKKSTWNLFSNLGETFGALFTGDTYKNGFLKTMKNIWSFDVGTNYVPKDHLAMVHKGEMVVPARFNPSTSGLGGNSLEVVNAIERLISVVEEKDMNAYISGNAIGNASQKYINNKSRIMGRTVV
jgi:hypothetical protein